MDDIHSEQAVIVVPGNVPAFLLKLWNILENLAYNTLISWNQVRKIHSASKLGKNCSGYDCYPSGIYFWNHSEFPQF